jgi:hypothetical protein
MMRVNRCHLTGAFFCGLILACSDLCVPGARAQIADDPQCYVTAFPGRWCNEDERGVVALRWSFQSWGFGGLAWPRGDPNAVASDCQDGKETSDADIVRCAVYWAVDQWNRYTGIVRPHPSREGELGAIYPIHFQPEPAPPGQGDVRISGSPDLDGLAECAWSQTGASVDVGDANPLGVTILGVEITFDSSRTWTVEEARSTALHELGHALGLGHAPEECGWMMSEPKPRDLMDLNDAGNSIGLQCLYGRGPEIRDTCVVEGRRVEVTKERRDCTGGVCAVEYVEPIACPTDCTGLVCPDPSPTNSPFPAPTNCRRTDVRSTAF